MRRIAVVGLLVAAGLSSSIVSSAAMTIREVEMTCPYDGTKFTFHAQGSGTTFDKTLDLMSIGPIQSPWPIAVCPTNGFVFIKDEYTPEDFERLRPIVFSPEYQALKGETDYYRAAFIMQRDGATHARVSTLLLQATWEAGQEELRERYHARPKNAPDIGFREFMKVGTQSDRYRRYATELLERLRDDIAAAPSESGTYKILTGELLRRLGRFEEADEHFKTLSASLEAGSKSAKVVAFERALIAKRDIGIHLMSQVPK